MTSTDTCRRRRRQAACSVGRECGISLCAPSETHTAMLQVVLVSATLPHEVLEMTHKFMTDPVRVLVKRDELTLEVRLWPEAAWFPGDCAMKSTASSHILSSALALPSLLPDSVLLPGAAASAGHQAVLRGCGAGGVEV